MSASSLVSQIEDRAARAGLTPVPAAPALATYLELLARWDRRINLTAYQLDPPSPEAIDHLLIEPLLAARHVLPEDRSAMDVGSGGGSPALPLALACPWLRMVLIESKTRKAAFLREVARQLSIANVEVDNRRLTSIGVQPNIEPDIVTVRAVRMDQDFLRTLGNALKPGGRVFWFTTQAASRQDAAEFTLDQRVPLSGNRSWLEILRRRA